jgi:hypothetical protein
MKAISEWHMFSETKKETVPGRKKKRMSLGEVDRKIISPIELLYFIMCWTETKNEEKAWAENRENKHHHNVLHNLVLNDISTVHNTNSKCCFKQKSIWLYEERRRKGSVSRGNECTWSMLAHQVVAEGWLEKQIYIFNRRN